MTKRKSLKNYFNEISNKLRRGNIRVNVNDEREERFALALIEEAFNNKATRLRISTFGLSTLPKQIGKLRNLTYLEITDPRLTTIPAEIGNLINLEELLFADFLPSINIDDTGATTPQACRISHLPPEIGELSNLQTLNLAYNNLTSLPPEVGKLLNLQVLSLSRNSLTELPAELGSFTKLTYLDASHNYLSELPTSTNQLVNIDTLVLWGNQLPIPLEILAKFKEPHIILNYYFSVIQQKRKSINEIKLLVVGQGSVGKTSLVQQILHGTFDQNQDGRDIH